MYSSEGWKEALPLFESGDGHGRKDVFLTFDVCTWEERGELRLVGLFLLFSSHRRSGTGDVSLSVRSHVAYVVNHRSFLKKVKGAHVQACEQFLRRPTTEEKVAASRSDCEHEEHEIIVNSGASLHMMSKNVLTSGEKDTFRVSESTEDATVYVNDLDVFVTIMLLEDSAAMLSFGSLCEESLHHWLEMEKVMRCRSSVVCGTYKTNWQTQKSPYEEYVALHLMVQ